MGISLNKGQTISLSKTTDKGLDKVFMGLGWDPVKKEEPGFLGKLMGKAAGGQEIDLDASVIMLDANKIPVDIVSFSQLHSKDGSVQHAGDNLTGEGEGDDEVIHVSLRGLPAKVNYLVFTVNSFSGQTFDEVENAFSRLVDENGNNELCRYTLAEQGPHNAVIMASLEKTQAEGWQMTAHGIASRGRTVNDIVPDAAAVL